MSNYFYLRERLALERRSRDERLQEEQRIQNLLKEKQMMYSAMNAQIITDILDNSIDDNEQVNVATNTFQIIFLKRVSQRGNDISKDTINSQL